MMRRFLLLATAASTATVAISPTPAQTPDSARRAQAAAALTPRAGMVVMEARRPAETVQIEPVVAPPAMPGTVVVKNANPLAALQQLPVQRQLSQSEMRSTRALPLGSSTIDLAAMLDDSQALPTIARRLEASPAVKVNSADVNAYVVPQGLIVRSFLNYQVKAGSCSDPLRRQQVESAGAGCAHRLSEGERVSDYSDPSSARFVEDPSLRAQAIEKARRDWARQDSETAAQVANFRAILANPAERQKIAAEIGEADTARLEGLDDDALAGELISSAETKIEDVMFIPKADAVDSSALQTAADFRRQLAVAGDRQLANNQPIDKVVFLTGFTLGRQYEWSKRVEKTIKWCLVGCATTYYAGARAGFSYGFGLRFPIVVDGKYRRETDASGEHAYLTATMTPVNGTPAQYSSAGLASSQIFNGQEFVAELKASAGYDYKLPLIGEDHRTLTVGYDLADKLPAPYEHGQFTPPAPGTSNNEIPFVLHSVDLLAGYGNWGAAGVLVHPAVKVGLHSDALKMTVHDSVANTDQAIVNGARLPLAIDPGQGLSRFSIGSPVYNLGFIVTPGVEAKVFIDVGVWSNDWNFPVWFPDIAITLPPGGVDFSCHSGTVCRRDYAYSASARPDLSGLADAVRATEVMDAAAVEPAQPAPPAGVAGESVRPQRGQRQRMMVGTMRAMTCADGLVERRATANDRQCVSVEESRKIAAENAADEANHDPAGAYGPATCVNGLVWREAVRGDQVCVTPERRAEVARSNPQ